jgi:hypothetical protein
LALILLRKISWRNQKSKLIKFRGNYLFPHQLPASVNMLLWTNTSTKREYKTTIFVHLPPFRQLETLTWTITIQVRITCGFNYFSSSFTLTFKDPTSTHPLVYLLHLCNYYLSENLQPSIFNLTNLPSSRLSSSSGQISTFPASTWLVIYHLSLLAGTEPPHRTLGSIPDK